MKKDAFDQYWELASKPLDVYQLRIPAELHYAVTMLSEDQRKVRAIVNETVRTRRTALRPAGSADSYRVSLAPQ